MEDLTGKQLGPYQVVAPLGEGGMAAVYKAYQPAMDRYVALKILPRHFAADPNFIARFRQEAKVLAKLQHPHILPVFDFGEADGYTYIVMPFIASGTLTSRLPGQPLPLDQINTIVSQVGDALDYAHSRGLLHRDVKPSNVLIDERGNCLLTDFGLAKIVEGSTKLTTTGGIMGTPTYMSPEQGLGQKLDARSDVYSLGVILYEMATGRAPYNAETPMAVVIKHINDPLPPPRTVNAALPEALERVILKSLAKSPGDRFATAKEMVTALQTAVGEATLAPAPSRPAVVTLPFTASPPPAAAPPQVETPPAVQPATPPIVEKPAGAARPAPSLQPIWQLALLAAVGWDIAIVIGVVLQGAPLLSGALCGVVIGGSLGLVWRRIESTLPMKRVWTLAAIWAICMAVVFLALGAGPLVVLAPIAAVVLTGLVMRRVQPALTWKHIGMMVLGWALGLLVGGILFTLATSRGGGKSLGAVLLMFIGVTLAGWIGSGVTFGQYRRAAIPKTAAAETAPAAVPAPEPQAKGTAEPTPLAPPAPQPEVIEPMAQPKAKRKFPIWIMLGAGMVGCSLLGILIATTAGHDRAATQTPAQPAVVSTIPANSRAELTLWYVYNEGSAAETVLKELIGVYQNTNPNIKINLTNIPGDQMETKWQTQVVAGGGPDMFVFGNDNLGDWARAGLVLPLDDLLQGRLDHISETAIAGMAVSGRIYGVPQTFKAVALYYNKSAVATPPATTEDLLRLVRGGKRLILYPDPYYQFGFFVAFGGKLMDADGKCIADQGGFADAMQYLLDLQAAGAEFESDTSKAQSLFQSGQADMIIDGPWDLGSMRSAVGPNLGVAVMPSAKFPAGPMTGVEGFYINPNSKNPQAAVDLALFLTNTGADETYVEAGNPPVRTDIEISDPLHKAFTEAAAAGVPRPQVGLGGYWEPFSDMFTNVLEGKTTPAEGVAQACAAMNAANGK